MARGNGATARASTIPAGLFPTGLCRRSGNLFPPLGGHTFGSRLSALAPECHGSRVLALLGRAPHDVDGVADHLGRTVLAFGTSGHILYPCALLSAKHIINRGQKRGCVMPIVPLLQEAAFDPEATHILTTAFNKAWDKFKSSGSALADDACAPSTRALLAKQIIETARMGERNIDHLVENGAGLFAGNKIVQSPQSN